MNRLKELRNSKGLTLRELGDLLHITYTALSKAENGQRNLNDNDINILCDFFKVTSDYLLCRTNNNQLSKESEELSHLTIQERYILDSIKTLTTEQLQELIKYIEVMKIRDAIGGFRSADLQG